jgi:hypothetical protein
MNEMRNAYKILVGKQEVRWEGEGYQTADNYTFFY